MVFSEAEMLLESPHMTPLPTPRMSSPVTVCSLAQEPDQAMSAPCWTNMRTQVLKRTGIENPNVLIGLNIEYD
jgi:hypothetical protein